MVNQLAWGFVGLQSLFAQRVSTLNMGVINDAVGQSLAEYNRQVDALLANVVQRTQLAQERFMLPGAGTLQPLDEWGNPLPVRAGAFVDLGFPIHQAGTAWGTNRVSRELMTVAEANDYTVLVQQQDADWIRRHILGTLLDNTSWIFTDPQVGALTVQPLANNDAVTYLTNGVMATDNHYLFQAGAIADNANPYPLIWTELTEHPGNSGPIVAYIASDLRATTEALATFVPVTDPDIAVGSGTDRVAGVPAGILAFGDEVIGKVDGVWIVVWSVLPSGYIVALAQGAASSALAMREFPAPGLQGFFEEDHSPDGNLFERRFLRMAGFGARNRTAALAYQIGAGSYSTPSGYATPMPI